MARGILDIGFRSTVRPELGFELMRFSQLARRDLPHPLDAYTRPSFFLVYIGLKGRARHPIDFERHLIGPHDVAVVAPGRVQAFDPTPGLDMWMVLFTPEFLQLSANDADPLRGAKLLSPFWQKPVLRVPPSERPRLDTLIDHLQHEYARPADGVQLALLSSLLRSLLLNLERLAAKTTTKADPPPELEAFQALLERRHAETRSVDDYARALGVTPRRLNQLTRTAFGAGAKHTIDARVVLELKRLLAYTTLSVKALSARFHFDEPTNLVKFFKAHTGLTPLTFRQRNG
ncbi:MAG: helix-turn-helix domain-containing protein [Myxococcaceae bacterium]|nr:helix-turn-helix domain-containing protein [Myxococcaceae bacterium]